LTVGVSCFPIKSSLKVAGDIRVGDVVQTQCTIDIVEDRDGKRLVPPIVDANKLPSATQRVGEIPRGTRLRVVRITQYTYPDNDSTSVFVRRLGDNGSPMGERMGIYSLLEHPNTELTGVRAYRLRNDFLLRRDR